MLNLNLIVNKHCNRQKFLRENGMSNYVPEYAYFYVYCMLLLK